ncbi:restriction endonuclease subunit S, partial [Synechococcus sp. AH-736-M02]|nr:restriction endonuclease subunit S [Synechococcus sp. AH-736-M02]
GDGSLTKNAYRKTGFTAYSASGADGFIDEFQNEGEGIVISSVGAQCGKIFRASGKWTAINNTIAITEKDANHSIDYLYQLLSRQDILLPEGGAQPFISQKEVIGATLHVPPLPEQKKIAEILSGVDRQITLLQTRINSLQRQKKAMLNLLYDAPFDSSDSLQDLCDEDICYGVLQYNEDGIAEVPVVQIKNLDAWDLGGMKRIPVSLDKKFARSRIQGGDLLISVKGSVGKIALVPEGFTGNISRDIARVRTKSSEITPDFLKYWFASDHGVETLARIEVGTTRAELSIGKLRTLQVAYPPIKTQNKICDIARSIDHALTAMNKSLEKHGILKKGLSADLLSGRKRVSV